MTRAALPDWRTTLPWPAVDAHKHARGQLGVVSGKANQTGAARLAARAGLRIGAGVVRILCPPDATAVIAPAIEAIMLTPFASDEALAEAAAKLDAVVIGPAAELSGVSMPAHAPIPPARMQPLSEGFGWISRAQIHSRSPPPIQSIDASAAPTSTHHQWIRPIPRRKAGRSLPYSRVIPNPASEASSEISNPRRRNFGVSSRAMGEEKIGGGAP